MILVCLALGELGELGQAGFEADLGETFGEPLGDPGVLLPPALWPLGLRGAS